MNLMGNIFTVLILLMSTVFLVIAVMVGASDRSWKNDAQAMSLKVTAAQNALSSVRGSQLKKEKYYEAEKVSRALQLSALESQLKRLQDTLDQAQIERDAIVKTSQQQLRELEAAQNRIGAQDKELAELAAANKKLIEDIADQFQTVRNLTAQNFELSNQVKTASDSLANTTAQLARVDKVMKKNGLNENSNTDHIEPKIEAVVSNVFPGGLFAVKIGNDDGLRIGHEMDIFRRKQFVGKGRVVEAKENVAVLRIVEGMMNDQVREGDSVSTKL